MLTNVPLRTPKKWQYLPTCPSWPVDWACSCTAPPALHCPWTFPQLSCTGRTKATHTLSSQTPATKPKRKRNYYCIPKQMKHHPQVHHSFYQNQTLVWKKWHFPKWRTVTLKPYLGLSNVVVPPLTVLQCCPVAIPVKPFEAMFTLQWADNLKILSVSQTLLHNLFIYP